MKSRFYLLFGVLVLLVTMLLSECILRIIGFAPGVTSSKVFRFNSVDTIKNYNYFVPDGNGLQIANVDCTSFFRTYPLDSTGFLQPNFRQGDSIMYIGDSFLWGAGASNADSTFFSLLANGYNFGIPGADLPQYSKIIEMYGKSPNLKQIVLCFYMGNDILNEDRPVIPYCDTYFETNAGFLLGYYQNRYLSLEESVEKARSFYLVETESWPGKVSYHSSLLTFLFYTIPQWASIRQGYDKGDYALVNTYLLSMQKMCQEQNCKFSVFVIPSTNDLEFKSTYRSIFTGVANVHWSGNIFEPSDFEETSHFNDSGHRKFANYIRANL